MGNLSWAYVFDVTLPFFAIVLIWCVLETAKDGIVWAVGRIRRATTARSAGKE
jgi:hypothetical protein